MFRPTLDGILSGLSSTVTKLEKFMEGKNDEIAEHVAEMNRHSNLQAEKSREVQRADRVANKLRELLK